MPVDPSAPWKGDDDILYSPEAADDDGPAPAVRLVLEGSPEDIIVVLRELAGRTPLPRGRKPGQKSLTPSEVKDIRARIRKGETITSVALLYKRSPDAVSDIVHGRTHRGVAD